MNVDTWRMSQDELEEFNERCGIYEFDANMTKLESERLALEDMYARERDE